jgi:Leucine-rich repeat (LRR) protein
VLGLFGDAIIAPLTLSSTISNSIPRLELNLSFNFISGRIPDGNERSQLRALNLEGNRLDGSIPSTMGEFENLESLNLAQNRLTGLLPRQLFDLPLTELTVGGNSLDGTFPAEMTKATTLTGLLLGPNLFNTTIPTFFGELTNLKRLSMAVIPELKGRIPAEIGISLTKLEELTITETSVTGNIPDQISQLTDLQTLNLSSNSLARAIPDSLGLLTKLGKYDT